METDAPMTSMMARLSEDQQAALAEVRAAIHRHYPAEDMPNHVGRIDLVAQGERMLGHLETWLLDEEQKQMLQLHPWDVFLLHAAAYLCDIGLLGEDGDGATPKKAVHQSYRDPARLAQVHQMSHAVILHHGTHLGLRDTTISATVAEISRQAGVLMGEDAMPPGAETPVMDHVPVNIPLLAGAIRLAHALDLKARATAHQVCQYLPQPHAMAFETYDRSLDVIGVGPHPFLPGTIQVKLRCADAELHRALKHHERAVQQLLDQTSVDWLRLLSRW